MRRSISVTERPTANRTPYRMSTAERLFWTHVAPYGEVKLNRTKRLELRGDVAADGVGGLALG
jgi:hypothetical protein